MLRLLAALAVVVFPLEPNKNGGENSERGRKKGGLSPPMHAQIFMNERAVEFVGGLVGANQRATRERGGGFEPRKIRIRCSGRPDCHDDKVTRK